GKRHPEELGKPDFDFHFGIAAIDTGHAGEGVLALERYIVQFPDNDRARLELARGYFVLGELLRAREEFETVAAKKPPAGVQATIDRFLDSISAQETRYKTTASAYVEIGAGMDSNVNSGVGDAVINVPTLGTVQLAQTGVKSGDTFLHLGAGGQFSYPVAPGIALFGGASFEGKLHQDAFDQQFDQGNLGVFGGVSLLRDRDLYRATISYSTLSVDNARFRNVGALGGEWHRQLDELNTVSLFGQYAALTYPRQAVRDADFYALGVGWRRAFVHRLQPLMQLQALYGKEKNDFSPVRDDLSRDLVTLRAGVSVTPAPRWGLSAGVSYTSSRFLAPDPLFTARREDDYYGLDVGASYRFSKELTLRADYLHSDNRSNLALYKYDRDVVTVKLRYEFR
ncbi:MAG: outer membrane beta-barrel protein, partial [Burkholderiales bacterium]